MTTSPTIESGLSGGDDAAYDPRRWLSLVVLLSGTFMILLDVTIVNVAIPTVQFDLGASYGQIEWILSGYALTFGLTLIPGGRLGDRFGYRRLFQLGLLGFVVTSALCGFAQNPGQLITARVIQGITAGLLNPQIMAAIRVVFPAKERGTAYAAYGIVAGASVAVGPLLGGLLVNWNVAGLQWRSVFLINVPIGIVAMIAAARLLPGNRGRGGSLDPVGIILAGATVLLATVPLIQGRDGWSGGTRAIFFGGAVLAGLLFTLWELRRSKFGRDVLFDLRLFKHRSLAFGTAIGLTYFAGFIGLMFAVSLHLQLGLGRSALGAGLILMAFAVGSMVGGGTADIFYQRMGSRVLLLGSTVVAIGGVITVISLGGADASTTGVSLIFGLFIVGVGNGLVIAPSIDIAIVSVPPAESGSASGMINTSQRMGNAFGVAVVGVALFGALASHAQPSADAVTDQLRSDLVAAGLTPAAAHSEAQRFAQCYVVQTNGSDPTATPPGCAVDAGTPTGAAVKHALATAQASNFAQATQKGVWWSLVGVALTFLLALFLPGGKPEEPDWETVTRS
jgi:EmrB/QacA subfamily drug resistance transporter